MTYEIKNLMKSNAVRRFFTPGSVFVVKQQLNGNAFTVECLTIVEPECRIKDLVQTRERYAIVRRKKWKWLRKIGRAPAQKPKKLIKKNQHVYGFNGISIPYNSLVTVLARPEIFFSGNNLATIPPKGEKPQYYPETKYYVPVMWNDKTYYLIFSPHNNPRKYFKKLFPQQ
jgi:hypothetical protein